MSGGEKERESEKRGDHRRGRLLRMGNRTGEWGSEGDGMSNGGRKVGTNGG